MHTTLRTLPLAVRHLSRPGFAALLAALVFVGGPGATPAQAATPPAKCPDVALVPIAKFPKRELTDLARFFGKGYKITLVVRPAVTVAATVLDESKKLFAADRLVADLMLKDKLKTTCPNTVFIGFTDRGLVIPANGKRDGDFGYREVSSGVGVLSSLKLSQRDDAGGSVRALVRQVRMRKLFARFLGVMVFHRTETDNPRSVLFAGIKGLAEIDAMNDSFFSGR